MKIILYICKIYSIKYKTCGVVVAHLSRNLNICDRSLNKSKQKQQLTTNENTFKSSSSYFILIIINIVGGAGAAEKIILTKNKTQ